MSAIIATAACATGALITAMVMIVRPDDVQYWHDSVRGPGGVNRYRIFSAGMAARLEANAGPRRVVVLGDSLVAGMDVGAIHPAAINLGVGFDNIRTLSERVRGYRSLDTARAIVLAVGTNDLPLRDVESIVRDYGALLAQLPRGVPLFVSAVLPVDDRIVKARPLAKLAQTNSRIRALCERHPLCIFVPAPGELADEGGRLKSQFHEGDGLHLNVAGYATWKPALRAALQKVGIGDRATPAVDVQ